MTAIEKLVIIRKMAEEEFIHYANIAYETRNSSYAEKRDWAKDWLESIEKVITEDEDYAPKCEYLTDEDVSAAARKSAAGINFSLLRTRDEIYIRGFNDGQYWSKQQLKEQSKPLNK